MTVISLNRPLTAALRRLHLAELRRLRPAGWSAKYGTNGQSNRNEYCVQLEVR